MKNEFKLHTNRNFGTEQFSLSATVHSDNNALTNAEIEETIKGMDEVIHSQFQAVVSREIREKELIAENLSKRTEANNKVREAVTKMNLATLLERYTADELNAKFNELAQDKLSPEEEAGLESTDSKPEN